MDQQNRAARKKYHVIYKTTCTVTGKYYIGMHSTDNLDDGYKGSGKRLWSSIRKYGVDKHLCEVLEYLTSRAALRLREAELVDKVLLEDKQCMNLTLGGEGGWEQVNANLTPKQRTAAGKAGGFANLTPIQRSEGGKLGGSLTGKKNRQSWNNKVRSGEVLSGKTGWETPSAVRTKISQARIGKPTKSPGMTGKKHSEETKLKMKAAALKMKASCLINTI